MQNLRYLQKHQHLHCNKWILKFGMHRGSCRVLGPSLPLESPVNAMPWCSAMNGLDRVLWMLCVHLKSLSNGCHCCYGWGWLSWLVSDLCAWPAMDSGFSFLASVGFGDMPDCAVLPLIIFHVHPPEALLCHIYSYTGQTSGEESNICLLPSHIMWLNLRRVG